MRWLSFGACIQGAFKDMEMEIAFCTAIVIELYHFASLCFQSA